MLIELDKLRNKERLRAAWLKDAVQVVFTNCMLIELDKLRNKERLRTAWLKDAVYAISGHLVEGNNAAKKPTETELPKRRTRYHTYCRYGHTGDDNN